MIEIFDLPYFKTVVAHAKSVGGQAWPELRDKLRWLSKPGNTAARNLLRLYKDFAPYSFEFILFRVPEDGCRHVRLTNGDLIYAGGELHRIYNGGIIYYAGSESGVSGQFSVTTSGRTDSRWEVHT